MRVPLGRIVSEKRRVVVPLLGGLVLNVVIFGLIVYPLTRRATGAAAREASALQELAAAQREQTDARALSDGKRRTDSALEAFYKDILPGDLASARRITYLHLAQLAKREGLQAGRRSTEPVMERDSSLGRLKVSMVLQGDYESVRRFIYDLESASEFVVIEDVALVQGAEANAPLMVTLTVATYYRAGAHET
jgi:Tfp pilus assembly protein PilO